MLPKLHEGSIATCQMSNDGKLLVTGSYDLSVILWDIENLTYKLVLRVRKITNSSFSIN
jgi:WD40 repeat protein